MKSERRHELQHNELADWMVTLGAAIKPYANVLLGGVLLIVILIIFWTWTSGRSSAETTRAWEDFYSALSKVSFLELKNVAEHYPKSDAAQWARVVVGDLYLAEACNERFTSREGANQELKKARESYDEVLADCKDPTIRERATFGLARVWESQGALDKAIDCYKKLAETQGPYGAIAKARITVLGSPATRQFYNEFAQFDPKPAFREDTSGPLPLDSFDNMPMPGPGESLFPEFDYPSGPSERSKESGKAAPQPVAPSTDLPETPANSKDDATTKN